MANIYIIDDIKLNHRGLQTKDEKGSWVDLHCQQGRLDGACVVYSTIMALLCLDFLSEEDIDIWKKKNPDRRTLKGKLLSHLLDEQGLIRDGYYLKDMASELKAALRNYKVNHIVKQDCVFEAKECIETGNPVILQVLNDNFNHAILAIGTEYEGEESNEKLLKLFCLDPGYNKSKPSYWNCVIDTRRKNTGKYPYWYITDENTCKVEIKEMITFEEL